MKTLTHLLLILAFLCSSQAQEPKTKNQEPSTSDARRPNIVLIFIDDMGYGDIGPFGNTVNQTPHLDRMAAEGNTLRQFYVANTACTPSRAALLTGSYAHRIGMDGMVTFPGEDRGLNPDEITIAEMLKDVGYTTGIFGKWHLGDQKAFLPLAQGFDHYFGIPYSNDMWPGNARGNPVTDRGPYEPLPIMLQNEAVAYVADGADQSLLAEVITDAAVEFIKDNKDQPFFCYVPHSHVHTPRYARPDFMNRAEGNVDRATVEEVDDSVGRILDTLRELKIDDNTLVIFTSDNGGAGGMSMGPLRGGKGGSKFEGHMRVPTIAWWPGQIEPGVETNEIAVTIDLLPSFAKLTGAKVPTDRTVDGKDALDIVLGKPGAQSPHPIHYYEVEGIRRGDWKMVKVPIKGKGIHNQLFHLAEDLGEENNIAKEHPALVRELDGLLTKHAESIAADTRPAAFVDNAKPILTEPGDLPKLRDYIGKPDTVAAPDAPQAKGALPQLETKNQKLKTADASRPDILFIAIDDMNDWTTLFDDDNPIQTPNLKRLAARGTFFTRAYCASPGCNPSRTAIMTGLRPTTSGVYGNPEVWAEKLPDVVTLPQYFEHHGGYATRGAGKIFHHGKSGADRPDNPSFQEFFQKLAIRGPGPNQNYNGYRKPDNPRLGNLGFDWGVHDQKMIDVDMCEWVEARMEEDWDQPLFLAAGIFNPHLPFYAPQETFDRYPLDKTALPPMPKGDLDDVGEIARRMVRKEFWVYDNTMAAEPGSAGSLQRMVQCYQAATDYADQMVGRLIDKLDETGRADNTIIVLWSDHGYHLGDKESCVKFTLWEKANRVPFIIVAPGVGKPGQVCDRPVSLVDIYPTLLDLAGLPKNEENDGLSLVPLLEDPDQEWKRPALMTEGPGNHAVRSDLWRYIRYADGTEELYDHTKDPWEHTNLLAIGDPEVARKTYGDVLDEHRKWLPKKEAEGVGMSHLYQSPPPAGAGLPNSGYAKTRTAGGEKGSTKGKGKGQAEGSTKGKAKGGKGKGGNAQSANPAPEAKPAKPPFPVVEHLLPPASRSLLPQYTFADTLEEQEKELAENPLMKRLARSRAAQDDDPYRPYYHYVNPEGRMNDPNGLCYWQGRWHLFYQAYPPEDPRQHWGHAVSDDLIHWKDLPVAIYPVPEDKCFSGSTLVEEDRVIAAYHGIGRGTMIAVSSDPLLLNWEKVTGDAVIKLKNEQDPDLPYEVFDPSIWKQGDYYYLLTAGQNRNGPAGKMMREQFLHRSKDLANWEYLHTFLEDDHYGLVGDDGACPYFWPIGTEEQGKHIMLHFSHMSGGKYLLGDYDTERQKFVVTDGGDFNHGPVAPGGTHAPSACPDPEDPEAVIGLFNMNPGMRYPDRNHWNQIMSLPRRWTLSPEGKLLAHPAGDLQSLRGDVTKIENRPLPKNQEIVFENVQGNAMEIQLEIEPENAKIIELNVLRSPDAEEFTRILFHPESGMKIKDGPRRDRQQRVFTHGSLTIDTSRSTTLNNVMARGPEVAPVLLKKKKTIKMRVFIDRSIVEVFINGQSAAVRVYPGLENSTGVSLRAIGNPAKLTSLKAWPMENIYQ
ncbi:MAG: sulfatase-like hydrolase/transferase [Verrucomicrobiota bacterium]